MSDGGFASRGPEHQYGRGVTHDSNPGRDPHDPKLVRADLEPILAQVEAALGAVEPAIERIAACEWRHEFEAAKTAAGSGIGESRRLCRHADTLTRRYAELRGPVEAATARVDDAAARLATLTERREAAYQRYLASRPGLQATNRMPPIDDAAPRADQLPHLPAIQASFGRHDVSGVRARVGGGAAGEADALGAEAFVRDGEAAFAQAPDLHTAAHEAAHAVQQRQGVVAPGVGAADGAHEAHADRVADAVVAGESAEALLAAPAADPVGAAPEVEADEDEPSVDTAPVQRKAKGDGLARAPKDARLTPTPRTITLRADIGKASAPETVVLLNRTASNITIRGALHEPTADTHGQLGDFAAKLPTGDVPPGVAFPLEVTFRPTKGAHEGARGTLHKERLRVIGHDQAIVATVKLRGLARPMSEEAREAIRGDAVKDRARAGDVDAPATWAEMERYVRSACDLVDGEERIAGARLARAVRDALEDRLPYDKYEPLLRERHGMNAQFGVAVISEAKETLRMLAVRAEDGATVRCEQHLDAFLAGEKMIRYVLGEDKAPAELNATNPLAEAVEGAVDGVVDFFADFKDPRYGGGFVVGTLIGAKDAIVDVLRSIPDLVELTADVVATLLPMAPEEAFVAAVNKISDVLGDLDKTAALVGKYFASKWHAAEPFARGRFRGEVVGYFTLLAVMAAATGGAAAAVTATGRWAQIARVLRTIDAIGDVSSVAATAKKLLGKGKQVEHAADAADAANDAAKLAARHADDAARATQGLRRSPDDLRALEQALPDELRGRVAVIESDAIQGAGVHVAYKDGELRIEVGPDAEPRHVKYHANTAKDLLRYQGPLGQVRKLLDAILTKLKLTPGFGTRGFEARKEVQKLREIEAELQALQARLDDRVRELDALDDLGKLDRKQLDRELADIQEQLEYHQGHVDSYEPGQGFVAAEGKGRGLPELPVKRASIFTELVEQDGRVVVEYYARDSLGEPRWLGKGYYKVDDAGSPVSYPEFTLHATEHIDGANHAIHIYDDVAPGAGAKTAADAVGNGARHSVTDVVLDDFLKKYERRHGHPPDVLGGSLEWGNKLNFQREYHRLRVANVARAVAEVEAVKAISFGRHRIAHGYDDFRVATSGGESVDLGEPFGVVDNLPDSISVTARRSSQ